MIGAELLKGLPLFASLGEAELERFSRKAADVRLEEGEWLIREGERPSFGLLLEGRLQMVKDVAGRPQRLDVNFQLGDFFGEIPILMGTPSPVSIQAATRARVARFDPQHFHVLMRESKAASALVLQAMSERVSRAQKSFWLVPGVRVLILGAAYDTDGRDVRSFLAANRIPYEWVDRTQEPGRVPPCVPADVTGPAVVIDGHTCIHPPALREVARALGLQTEPNGDGYDVVIVGAGPAGMAAGVYGASEGLKVLLVERSAPGGQAGTSSRIENYLGFPEAISGEELTGRALQQALRFGAEVAMTRTVEQLIANGSTYRLQLDGGRYVQARAVLLATGVEWRRLEVEGAQRLLGRGVLYGFSRTEAFNVNGKRLAIVGGGNSAGQAALFFSSYASEVKLVVRGEGLSHGMSQYLIGQLASKANVEVLPFTQVVAAEGEQRLERIVLRTQAPGQEAAVRPWDAEALFVMIGAAATTGWLPSQVERDANGYVCTGRDLQTWALPREAFPLETSLPGVFCAGDVRHGSVKRVSSGVGEGSMAISFIHQYLALQEAPVHRG